MASLDKSHPQGNVLQFKPRPKPVVEPTQHDELTFRDGVKAVIQELFNSESFQSAMISVVEKREKQMIEERQMVVTLVKRLAKLANVDTREVYTMLQKHLGSGQGDAGFAELQQRRQLLCSEIDAWKEANKQRKVKEKCE